MPQQHAQARRPQRCSAPWPRSVTKVLPNAGCRPPSPSPKAATGGPAAGHPAGEQGRRTAAAGTKTVGFSSCQSLCTLHTAIDEPRHWSQKGYGRGSRAQRALGPNLLHWNRRANDHFPSRHPDHHGYIWATVLAAAGSYFRQTESFEHEGRSIGRRPGLRAPSTGRDVTMVQRQSRPD